MKALTALLALTLAATAGAQSTWKNLRFGQSRDDVRNTLTTQGIAVETSQEGSLQSTSDFQLFVPGLRHTLPLHTEFRFTDAGGLMDITLSLDFAIMKQNFPSIGGDEALLNFASDKLTRALTDRYATPISRQADCDADAATVAKRPVACAINWHDPGQSVELDWYTHGPRLFIRYQMLAPDL